MSEAAVQIKNHGWRVTFAGTGINLALGILYTWSVFKAALQNPEGWNWTTDMAGLPYAICVLVFAFATIPGGRMQDKFGPRLTATIGGILVGIGMLVCAFAGNSHAVISIGFGLIVGTGIGFAYASATPPAIKWFPARKIGLIAGLVVSGFGLASLYIAPLATWSLGFDGMLANNISSTFLYFGIAFFVVVTLLAQLLKPPPAGYTPVDNDPGINNSKKSVVHGEEVNWKQMLAKPQFYMLWVMYFCGAGVGLMVIGQAKTILKTTSTEMNVLWLGTVCLMLLAVGNGAGRIIAGVMSDKFGRTITMFTVFLIQALMMSLMILLDGNSKAVYFISANLFIFLGFNYGACLSVFPAATKDFFGLKNFGLNYGIVFTSWGVGGFVLTRVAGLIKDKTGTYIGAFWVAIGVLIIAMILTFVTKPPHHKNATAVESK